MNTMKVDLVTAVHGMNIPLEIPISFEIPAEIQAEIRVASLIPETDKEEAITYRRSETDGYGNPTFSSVTMPWTTDKRYTISIGFNEDGDQEKIIEWAKNPSVRSKNNGIFCLTGGGDGVWLMPVIVDEREILKYEIVPRF